jgi:hypothetical protein
MEKSVELQMIDFFTNLLDTRSKTAIEYLCDNVIAGSFGSQGDLQACKAIIAEHDLDKVYILCHDRLAYIHMQESNKLREWVARKETKKC